ncbi:MAG: DUF4760 domain-containing protein [Desulfarculus sp.]|nr:DUF4760 domain-containing protein [Desulfarculus sp.]
MSTQELVSAYGIFFGNLVALGPAIQAIVGILMLITIGLVWWQVVSFKKWNALNAAFTYLPNPLDYEKIESQLDEVIGFWKRKDSLSELEVNALLMPEELTDKEINKLAEKWTLGNAFRDQFMKTCNEQNRKLKLYINMLESYCCAINLGVVDERAARVYYEYKFISHHLKVEPYINKMRTLLADNTIWCEFDNTVKKWKPTPQTKKIF